MVTSAVRTRRRLLAPRRARLRGRVDRRHHGAFCRQRLGEDPAAAPDVEGALAPEPPEHAAKILHPRRVELVQPHERACVGPPDVGQTLDESLVLLGLRQPAEPRQVIAHPGTRTPITSPSRIGTTAETTRGSVAASRLNARTPSVPGEQSASSTTEP